MKHFLLLLLAALSLISCSDDSNPVTPSTGDLVYSPKKVTVYTTGNGTKVFNFTHDSRGNVLTITCEGFTRSTFTYDSLGNRLSSVSESYSGNNWVVYDSTNYTYDAQNNLVSAISGDTRTTCIRDLNSNLLSETTLTTSADTLIFGDRYSYTYLNNKKTSELHEMFSRFGSNTWEPISRKTISYNENNQIFTELSENYENGSWQNSQLWTHSYAATGEELSYLTQSWQDGAWSTGFISSFIYDANKNTISWYNRTLKMNFKYNSNNLRTETEHFVFLNSDWQTANFNMSIVVKKNNKNYEWFNLICGYKMTVEYASFQVPATNSSVAPAVSLPELVPHEMIERLAPYNNHKRN